MLGKQVVYSSHGDLSQLFVEEVTVREPGPEDAVLAVAAAAVNHLDLDLLAGTSRYPAPLPHVLGMEAAGVVVAVGSDAQRVRVGDRVMMLCDIVCGKCRYCSSGRDNLCQDAYRPGLAHPGAYSEYVTVPERGLVVLPDSVSYESAACLQIAFGTAQHMLVAKGRVGAGEWVLVSGAGGTIGHAAVQIAKLAGARVIAVSSSPSKREKLLVDGADAVADYNSPHFLEEVSEITGGNGVDLSYEHVGGSCFPLALQSLREGGRMVVCGGHGGEVVEVDLIPFFRRELSVHGSNSATQKDIDTVFALLCQGRINCRIAATFPLRDAARAMEVLQLRQNYGRVLIAPLPGGLAA